MQEPSVVVSVLGRYHKFKKIELEKTCFSNKLLFSGVRFNVSPMPNPQLGGFSADVSLSSPL